MPSARSSVAGAIAPLARGSERLVLAVSGGLDSMVLLDAAARVVPPARLRVATFDHGTGEYARRAVACVLDEARRRGIRVDAGRAGPLPPTEAAWREARWRFLREVARAAGATIVTAHTADDQVETVVMRALRDAGARGLAGLYAAGDVRRPFVRLGRAELGQYAARHALRWVEDPSNADMRYLRNRLRRDVIPALERARPGLSRELLAVAERAAEWRAAMDALALDCCPSTPLPGGGLSVAAADLVGYDPSSLAVLWSSIAGRVGVALTQRGTRRLVAFTMAGAGGGVMPLSGRWQVVRHGERVALQRTASAPPAARRLSVHEVVPWGRWRFRPHEGPCGADAWTASLPADRPLEVRSWEPADRVPVGTGRVRVKRMLAEAGIAATERVGWPVVVADDAIVWIPGVSRGRAATARSGRPGVCIRCEPSDG